MVWPPVHHRSTTILHSNQRWPTRGLGSTDRRGASSRRAAVLLRPIQSSQQSGDFRISARASAVLMFIQIASAYMRTQVQCRPGARVLSLSRRARVRIRCSKSKIEPGSRGHGQDNVNFCLLCLAWICALDVDNDDGVHLHRRFAKYECVLIMDSWGACLRLETLFYVEA
jgi:hypothetical protein